MNYLFCEIHPHRKLNSKGKCRTCQQSASQNKTKLKTFVEAVELHKPRPVTNPLQKAKDYYLSPKLNEKENTYMSENKSLEQQLQDERNRINKELETNKEYWAIKDEISALTEAYNKTNSPALAKMLKDRDKKIAEFETSSLVEQLLKDISAKTVSHIKNNQPTISTSEILAFMAQMQDQSQTFLKQMVDNNHVMMLTLQQSQQNFMEKLLIKINDKPSRNDVELSANLHLASEKLEIEELKKACEKLNKRVVELEETENMYIEQLNLLNTTNADLNKAIINLENEKNKHLGEISDFKIELKHKEQQIKNLITSEEKSIAKITELEKELKKN